MRKFAVEVANPDNWERVHRVIRVKATTIKGALKRARCQMKKDEDVYQVSTRVRGAQLWQPVWDFFNGNMSGYYGLNL